VDAASYDDEYKDDGYHYANETKARIDRDVIGQEIGDVEVH
jgi:hypothetical protein